MKKLVDLVLHAKIIIALVFSLIAAAAWGIDYLHKPFLLKTDLMSLFNRRDITAHQVNISKLEIQKNLAVSQREINKFDLLISLEKVQILRLKGEKHGSN